MPKRALVVEDELPMRELIQEVLGGIDIQAVTLADESDAEPHFRDEKFDVILVGFREPDSDGSGLVQKIRNSNLNRITPIIMLSGDQRPSALSRGFEAGATFFAYKPIDRPRLMHLIRATQGAIEREKRRFRRVAVQARVRIKSDKMDFEGETIDLSLNGALISAPHTVPVGSLVEFSLFLLAGAKPIVGLGTIVRILNNGQMGVLIDRIPPAESGRLQEYLLPRILD
ncbi:MAG: response regulator [Acidobacteriia bacterium]|nr:response regulator [Terriglobia bacterium]